MGPLRSLIPISSNSPESPTPTSATRIHSSPIRPRFLPVPSVILQCTKPGGGSGAVKCNCL